MVHNLSNTPRNGLTITRRFKPVVGWASFLTLLFMGGCSPDSAKPVEQRTPSSMPAEVAEVVVDNIRQFQRFSGRLEAPQRVDLLPRISGYVEQVKVNEGDAVVAGQVLFQLDADLAQQEVERLQAEQARANELLQLAKKELRRAEGLRATNAISEEILDSRRSLLDQRKAALDAISAALVVAETRLSYTQVVAPITGKISRIDMPAGNYVREGQTRLTQITGIDPLDLYFHVPENLYLNYRAQASDRALTARVIDPSGASQLTEVSFVDNRIDANNGTVQLGIRLNNSDQSLMAGMFFNIELLSPNTSPVLLVRDTAILTDLNNRYVLVVDDKNTLSYRPVTLGQNFGGLREIKTGLGAEEKIVVNGLQRLRPGLSIEPIDVPMVTSSQLSTLSEYIEQQGE